MNPYRSSTVSPAVVLRRRHPAVRRKTFGIVLFSAGVSLAGPAVPHGAMAVAVALSVALLGIVLAVAGRSRTPLTRLCALTWHRGDRLGATMLLFNVIQPRYSAKRIARNRAALEAVRARCIEYPTYFPFRKD